MKPEVGKARRWAGWISLAVLVGLGAVLVATGAGRSPDVLAKDVDGDGRPDEWTYLDKEDRVVMFEKDKNHDGKPDWRDRYAIDPKSNAPIIARNEADSDYDGRFDTTASYEDGQLRRIESDRNGDGALDAISYYKDGRQAPYRIERDDDYDGTFENKFNYEDGPPPASN